MGPDTLGPTVHWGYILMKEPQDAKYWSFIQFTVVLELVPFVKAKLESPPSTFTQADLDFALVADDATTYFIKSGGKAKLNVSLLRLLLERETRRDSKHRRREMALEFAMLS